MTVAPSARNPPAQPPAQPSADYDRARLGESFRQRRQRAHRRGRLHSLPSSGTDPARAGAARSTANGPGRLEAGVAGCHPFSLRLGDGMITALRFESGAGQPLHRFVRNRGGWPRKPPDKVPVSGRVRHHENPVARGQRRVDLRLKNNRQTPMLVRTAATSCWRCGKASSPHALDPDTWKPEASTLWRGTLAEARPSVPLASDSGHHGERGMVPPSSNSGPRSTVAADGVTEPPAPPEQLN